ncbi:MAG: DNA/RNA non-specific endonuclease [candidate division WOR-3 bacterium]|nr:DNA/RNA non-specific endonuclease [candidate division WOR-3 bacterium]MCR4423891.1 DNA/RNA non-specific endonuclease [candidate division WOR-3 bacterium]MDH7519229.1 DNA/RNA non-specific endonuclease [bacterium]
MRRLITLCLLSLCLLGASGDSSLHPYGMPASQEPNLKVLHYRAFDCGYLPRAKISLWVSYLYHHRAGLNRPRYQGKFMPDTFRLKKSEAAFPAVYESVPRFIRHQLDKGHLAPDAAIKVFGTEAQKETYFLTNIIPQFASTNRFIWAALEKKIRDCAGVKDTVWVTVGPVFYRNRDTIWLGTHQVPIPHACYCVVFRRPAELLAFVVPNDSIRRTGKHLPQFLVSVESVEKLTGLDLFPGLAPARGKQTQPVKPKKIGRFRP